MCVWVCVWVCVCVYVCVCDELLRGKKEATCDSFGENPRDHSRASYVKRVSGLKVFWDGVRKKILFFIYEVIPKLDLEVTVGFESSFEEWKTRFFWQSKVNWVWVHVEIFFRSRWMRYDTYTNMRVKVWSEQFTSHSYMASSITFLKKNRMSFVIYLQYPYSNLTSNYVGHIQFFMNNNILPITILL